MQNPKTDRATKRFLGLSDIRHGPFLKIDRATQPFLKSDRATQLFFKFDKETLPFLMIDMQHGDSPSIPHYGKTL